MNSGRGGFGGRLNGLHILLNVLLLKRDIIDNQ